MYKLYDAQITRVRELLRGLPVRSYAYDEAKAWPENDDFVMIFQRDAAYELGGKGVSANLTCVTEDESLFDGELASAGDIAARDQIFVYGPDLQEIQGDVSYARICEVLVRGEEEKGAEGTKEAGSADMAGAAEESALEEAASQRMLKLLQDVDFVKFHIYGKGVMMRTSGQSAKEQVRIAREALQGGITFERMGDLFISHYKKNPRVLAVHVSFITAKQFDYERLAEEGSTATQIRNSLSMIQKGLPTEC
ncbi:MAG: hypothetical protein J5721_02955, partial [Lachnospiraceae bacterium]|nr:hypothetical protein [Lachnospiraceae bacterium]